VSTDPSTLPVPLAKARNQFAEWRATRARQTERTPPALWKAAARCAARFGIYRTARALGVDYVCLKKRVTPATKRPRAPAPSRFVELLPPVLAPQPECVVELESRAGAKLRLELRGSAIPDLVELARRLGREEP
jgi:hypothetical protein